jgi:uncharacterized membrane protein YphA (DoxX/SURF4 family)
MRIIARATTTPRQRLAAPYCFGSEPAAGRASESACPLSRRINDGDLRERDLAGARAPRRTARRLSTIAPDIAALPVEAGNDIRSRRTSLEQGLSPTRVSYIVQDDAGFLWFGTQHGLNRFDRREYRLFKHEAGQPGRLGGVFIHALFKDRGGELWVGGDQGLDAYNATTEAFRHFQADTDNPVVIHAARRRVQRSFSTFPGSRPGLELLTVRITVGVAPCAAMIDSLPRFDAHAAWIAGSVLGLLSGRVVVGLATPIAAPLFAFGALVVSHRTEWPTWLAMVGASVSLMMIGPGAWSIDAWLFGGKRIDIDWQ